jgi:V/A-type H+-transporting ATPase subunit I
MIVPMKKVWVICQAKDSVDTVNDLRKLGLVHVQHQQVPQGKDISSLSEDINFVNTAVDILGQRKINSGPTAKIADESSPRAIFLSRYPQSKVESPQEQVVDWKIACRHIIDLEKRLEQLKEYSRVLKGKILELQQWGDFDPQAIEALARRNIFIRFFQIPQKEINFLPEGLIVKTIFVTGGIANCVVISRDKKEIAFREILPAKASLSAMRHRLEEDSIVQRTLEKDLRKQSCYYAAIQGRKELLDKELKFQQALCGMGQEGSLSYLNGYIPIDSVDVLLKNAKEHEWAIQILDPEENDDVPTFIRTPKWVNAIKPVLGLLGITPGYRELDVSLLFLVFFSMFFGILIGDAGYGLVYILITIVLQKKIKKDPGTENVIRLFYILSFCAIAWGIFTGTFFGQEWLAKSGVRPLIPQLNDVKFMQTFCFFIGALHLSIAHSWRAALKFPSLTALADVGWICVLWTAFFLARTLILSESFPSWGMWLASVGIALVILFTNPQRNIFKTIGEGLGTVALSLMNNFTDVVSYVRLFAVGLAGVAIAETANNMASGLGPGVVAVIAGALIVVIGHGLNIVLGPMSVLVHGVRLNVLEFSGHASVTWSGVDYEPLRE